MRTTLDVAELYAALSPQLERRVRCDVHAPDCVIEDACQFAWSQLVGHRDRVHRDAALSWLAKTAVREAFKLIRREGRFASLDAAFEQHGERAVPGRSESPEQLVEQRERLGLVAGLPERQRQAVWLHALGLSYEEIALYTGWSPRTVERQLLRAKRRLGSAR